MNIKSYAAMTDKGPLLEVNEDGYDFDFNKNFHFVLDAFGGAGIGDQVIIRAKHYLKEFLFKLSKDPDATMPFYYNPQYLLEANALINTILNFHKVLLSENNAKKIQYRAGVSGVFLLKSDTCWVLCSVGKIQAYLFRHGQLTPIFSPETLKFYSGQVLSSPDLSYPLQPIGMYEHLSYQLKECRFQEGDHLLMCSDGISDWITEGEMSYHFTQSYQDDYVRLQKILSLSNSHGNSDNQTGMILTF